ncbi:hypothetical protein [Streptomyces sp. NBC_01237]|uniref:hypothetical protein n=1 Tax=Streptomyces sp. NBC_01237 TaxID=2903790 RepID=UPI002DDC8CAF|nr:hypothetical protein [Streptomyces sp. NBC_01237]WRZ78729.1 hypothetical protein OG251_44700 [Streptomyces sp. NBC_01237]
MGTYVIRPGTYPQLPPGLYRWTAVVAVDGTARAAAVQAVERYGETRIEYAQSAMPLAAEVLADIRHEPGMSQAALIQLRLHRS